MYFRLIVFFSFLFAGAGAGAQTVGAQTASIQGININADSMERDTENETAILEGHVQVIYEDQHLTAQRVFVNFRAKSLDAQGDVLITTPKANLAGERIIMDYETNTGVILDGYVQSGTVLFEGSQIHKLSEVDYVADNAKYTTCTTCPEAWSFSGTKIRAEIGGYAYMKNSTMRFAGLPVFWMPYLAVPLKSDRQSGLLTPSIGQRGLGGLTYSQAYFWAMSRSQDSTWTFTNYEFRGPKGLLNYRYVLTESSEGELDFGYLRDKVFGDDPRLHRFDSSDAEGIERYFVKYNHYYEMPDGLIHRAQINHASDLQYSNDFPLETLNAGDPAMESRTSVTKNSGAYHWSIDASHYQNLLQSNPLGGNQFAVHRLPEIRVAKTQERIGNSDFLAAFDLRYVNFARAGIGYDNLNAPYAPGLNENRQITNSCPGNSAWEQDPNCEPTYDGEFNQGTDLIRTGQRLDFRPTLYRPFRFNNLELFPRLGYRETHYIFPVGEESYSARRYLRADVSARTTFSRIYGDFSSLQSERYKHEIQPEITAATIPWLYHPSHPFFGQNNGEDVPFVSNAGLSNADLNGPAGLQFDHTDRLDNRKLVTFSLTNKLTRKYWEAGLPTYLQFLYWRLSQSYDVYQAEKNPDSQPLSDLASSLTINLRFVEIYQDANYFPYQDVTNTSTRVRLLNDDGDFFQLQHSFTYTISAGQERDFSSIEGYILSGKKRFSWIDLVGKLNYGVRPERLLQAWGYGAQIRLPGDCLFIGVTNFKPVGKKPEIELSVNFAWDGSSRPPLSESVLGTFGF